MRYCIFTANYLPNLGGVERYTLNLAKKLLGHGHEVTIVTSNVFHLASEEEIDGIQVFRLPCWNVLGGRFPVAKPSGAFRALHRRLLSREFDFVLVQARFYIHSLYGAWFAKKKGVPCVVLDHGTNHFTVNNPFWDAAGHLYEHMETALIKRQCRHFYGVSQSCCDWLAHFGIRAEGTLYNAVDLEEIRTLLASPVEDYRETLALGDSLVVTYTGRLVKEKGIEKLVDAVQRLRASGVNVHLLVAGDGDLYESIRAANHPGVSLLGRIDFPHIIALLRASDIFCLPTDYPEGFPTSVIEAAACGCYVVTTTAGGSKELILDDSYGTILTENTPETIAAAIRRAAEDPVYRNAAAGKALARLEQHFTWDATCSRFLEITAEVRHD